MRLFVLGQEDAVLGFSLVGVAGRAAHTADEINTGLDEVLQDGSIGIVLVTEDAADQIRERIDALKIESRLPLILEIPGSEGAVERPSLRAFISEAIGVSL